MKRTENIIGEKIILRPITAEDTGSIVKWRNKERVRNNFIFQDLFTGEMHRNWLESKVAMGEVEQFIIIVATSGKAIGSVYLRDIDTVTKTAEYGIFIGEDSEIGNGYGTIAAKMALEYAFLELGLERVFLRVYEDNAAAIKSYQKAGFEFIEPIGETSARIANGRNVVFMEKRSAEK